MRVLVCGGRDFADEIYSYHTLRAMDEHREITLIIHGDCGRTDLKTGATIGADRLGAKWALDEGCPPVKVFPADWKKHGKAAGPIRNQQMLNEGKPDLVLAFAGGKGTDDMCRRAREAGIEVRRFWPRKSYTEEDYINENLERPDWT